jgi:uncharacterized protein (TIGR02284 family)
MEKNEELIDILNDLVKINNDRIETYKAAMKESKDLDIDLKGIFDEMIRQSGQNKDELIKEMHKLDGQVEDEPTQSGKIYRAWCEIKATHKSTKTDRLSILANCEFSEDAAQRAYENALTMDIFVDEWIRRLMEEQQGNLKKSHGLIKKHLEAYKALQK